MKIVFSKHAKRRIETYGIDPDDVLDLVERSLARGIHPENIIKYVDNRIYKNSYPLKVYYKFKERTKLLIITVYPLRKGKNNED